MKFPRSRLGLAFSSCYLIGAIVLIIESACTPADWILCGRLLGALIVALPWTFHFNNEGELDTSVLELAPNVDYKILRTIVAVLVQKI